MTIDAPRSEPGRRRLPDTRSSITHKRQVCGIEIYVNVGFYDDPTTSDAEDLDRTRPGEIFVTISRQSGTSLAGVVHAWALMMSLGLQYGVSWAHIREKFLGLPAGDKEDCWTHPKTGQVHTHRSLVDGVVRAVDYCIEQRKTDIGLED